MIGQYLSNTNENATVPVLQKFFELNWALFTSEKISDFGTVALSFVCDKYYPIMD